MLVVNLYGGPGAGKSTVAAGVFYELRVRGINVELAMEWIKDKVFDGSPYPFNDQIYTYAKQRKRIIQLKGVDVVITDSPLLLGLAYDKTNSKELRELALADYSSTVNLNFYIERNHAYSSIGRRQSEQSAIQMDNKIKSILYDCNVKCINVLSTVAKDEITRIVTDILGQYKNALEKLEV